VRLTSVGQTSRSAGGRGLRPRAGVGDSRNQQVRDLLRRAVTQVSGVGQTSRSASARGLRPRIGVGDSRNQQVRDLLHVVNALVSRVGRTSRSAGGRGLRPRAGVGDSRNQQVRDPLHAVTALVSRVGRTSRSAGGRGLRPCADRGSTIRLVHPRIGARTFLSASPPPRPSCAHRLPVPATEGNPSHKLPGSHAECATTHCRFHPFTSRPRLPPISQAPNGGARSVLSFGTRPRWFSAASPCRCPEGAFHFSPGQSEPPGERRPGSACSIGAR
jgi:hypothetical protein